MDWNKLTMKNLICLVFGGILFYAALQKLELVWTGVRFLAGIFFPFFLGFAIAFILNVPMRKIEGAWVSKWRIREKLKRPAAYLVTLLAVIGVLFLAFFVIIPELANTFRLLVGQIQVAFNKLTIYLNSLNVEWPQLEEALNQLELDWRNLVQEMTNLLQVGAAGIFQSTISLVGGIINGFTTFFISFTFSIYLLFQKETLIRQFKKLLYALMPEGKADRVIYVGRMASEMFSNFLAGQCTEAVILGTMFFIVMSLIRMPYALLVGVLIAITALIPIFGAFIGCAVSVFLIVMVNPVQALIFVIIFLVLQQIEGNLIYPHVVGGTVGLPSIWVLAAVSIGGSLMGIVGMLLFIPASSVCYALLREFVNKQIGKKQVPREKWTDHEQPKAKEQEQKP